jgi:hypothetical protein
MKRQIGWGIFILMICMGPALAAAEIYQWIDEQGVLHFTDGPPPPGAQVVEGLSEKPPDEPRANPASGANVNAAPGGRQNTDPTEVETAAGAEAEQPGSASREEYWRRRGWTSEPAADGEAGPAVSRENTPAGSPEGSPAGGGENRPPDQDVGGAAPGGDGVPESGGG